MSGNDIIQLVWSLSITVIFVCSVIFCLRIQKFLLDYRFTRDGVDVVVLGGVLKVGAITKESIREIRWVDLYYPWHLFRKHPSRTVLIIKTTGGWRWSVLADDPKAAVEVLGIKPLKSR